MNKGLLALFLACLSISALTGFELYSVLAIPAPTQNSTCEPGGCTAHACRALVWKDGSQAVDTDGKSGVNNKVTGNDDAVIQDAMNNLLDAARSQMERVCLTGTFNLQAQLTIPSFTYFDASQAYLQVSNTNGFSGGMIQILAAHFVTFYGGTVDGKNSTMIKTATRFHGILITGNSDNVNIDHTTIKAVSGFGIYFSAGPIINSTITYNYIQNTAGSAITDDTGSGDITNIRITYNTIANYGTDPLMGGSFTAIHTEGPGKSRRWTITGNQIQPPSTATSSNAIDVATQVDGIISFNTILNAEQDGVFVGSSTNIVVSNNDVFNSGTRHVAGYGNGIRIDDTGLSPASTYVSVIGNIVRNSFSAGITERGTPDFDIIEGNILAGNGAAVAIVGTHDIVRNNPTQDPIGKVATPFTGGAPFSILPNGANAAPVASTTYTVVGWSIYNFTSTGGTGVVLTIKDAPGNCLVCGPVTVTGIVIPSGSTILFGAFSVAPTVKIYLD